MSTTSVGLDRPSRDVIGAPRAAVALLSLFALLFLFGFALSASAGASEPAAAPGEAIVIFTGDQSNRSEGRQVDEAGGQIEERLPLVDAAVVEPREGESLDAVERRLEASSAVADVEPNYRLEVVSAAAPNDPMLPLWGMTMIDAPESWAALAGAGEETVVAVIDTGVDIDHPELANRLWTNAGEVAGNSTDDDGNGIVDDVHGADFYNNDGNPDDDHNHGTHVSGTIGAQHDNSTGVAGVDPNVKIMGLKFLSAGGSGYTSDAVQAIDYAIAKGARIMSNSWGGGGYSSALRSSIQRARDAGILFVAAAGNSAQNADVSPMYPAAYDVENIVSVASTTSTDGLSSFSNYGASSVDLGAPGSSVLSTVAGGGYSTYSGTSMATPHVSGAASLLLSQGPQAGYQEIRAALLTSVDPVAALAGKTVTGGRLNVKSALDELNVDPPTSAPVNTQAPSISGTALVGSTLTCNRGSWDNRPTSYSYAWLRNGSAISGATSSSYALQSSDAGTAVSCRVTASNAAGSAQATSASVDVTMPAPPVNTSLPTISGTPTVGQRLTCNLGSWSNSPTSYVRQWLRDGAAISGATGHRYTLQSADAGTAVSCRVTATNAGGQATATSAAVNVRALEPPSNAYAPSIDFWWRPYQVGGLAYCWRGSWTDATGYTYRWLRDGQAISGATYSWYYIESADSGKTIACEVTATNAAGSTSVASAGVEIQEEEPPVNTWPPQVYGQARVGGYLWCWEGSWSPYWGVSYSYEWLRNGAVVSRSWWYNVTAADAGAAIACRVTATNSSGSSQATSGAVQIPAPPSASPPPAPPPATGDGHVRPDPGDGDEDDDDDGAPGGGKKKGGPKPFALRNPVDGQVVLLKGKRGKGGKSRPRGKGKIAVEWEASRSSAGIASYVVMLDERPVAHVRDPDGREGDGDPETTTSVSVKAGKRYTIYVQAVDWKGRKGASEAVEGRIAQSFYVAKSKRDADRYRKRLKRSSRDRQR